MRQFKVLGTAFAVALLVAACGGGGDGNQAPAVAYSSVVSFGDSLSDVGTYKVGTVAALDGGMYSINGIAGAAGSDPTPSKNWTELVAAQVGKTTCAAQTGLDGDATKGFSVPVVNHSGCFSYAQGGARVTNPVGPGNKLTGSLLGQLTVPVVTQINNHLAAVGGSFSATDLVTVMAGGNDVLEQLGELSAAATTAGQAAGTATGAQTFATTLIGLLASGATNPSTAAQAIGSALQTEAARTGHTDQTVVTAAVGAAAVQPGNASVASLAVYGPMVASAQATATAAGTTAGAAAGAKYAADNGPSLVQAMGTAGTELAGYVNTKILGNGAKHIVVVNLPDVSQTPAGKAQPSMQPLILAMVNAFNAQLSAGLTTSPSIILVDAFAENGRQIQYPDHYALTNVASPACIVNDATKNFLGSSLVCNSTNLNSGDVSHYLFADTVHPTPYGYKLLAQYVAKALVTAGWL